MGSLFSRPSFTEKFVMEKIDEDIVTAAIPKLYQDRSTIPGSGLGLFTEQPLAEGTVIDVGDQDLSRMNDPMFSMRTLLDSQEDDDFFTRWRWVHRDYYSENFAQKCLNCKILRDESQHLYLITTNPIRPNDELFRCYGFSTWLSIGINTTTEPIIQLLNSKNIGGFVRFLSWWLNNNRDDPLYRQITIIRNVLNSHLETLRQGPFTDKLQQVLNEIQIRNQIQPPSTQGPTLHRSDSELVVLSMV